MPAAAATRRGGGGQRRRAGRSGRGRASGWRLAGGDGRCCDDVVWQVGGLPRDSGRGRRCGGCGRGGGATRGVAVAGQGCWSWVGAGDPLSSAPPPTPALALQGHRPLPPPLLGGGTRRRHASRGGDGRRRRNGRSGRGSGGDGRPTGCEDRAGGGGLLPAGRARRRRGGGPRREGTNPPHRPRHDRLGRRGGRPSGYHGGQGRRRGGGGDGGGKRRSGGGAGRRRADHTRPVSGGGRGRWG